MDTPSRLILHGYWRSGPSYRTRIALALKGLEYEQRPVNLLKGEQRSEAYRALNPQGLVPALEVDGRLLTQSGAILEWLEEVRPDPPLLPRDPFDRAELRAMCWVIGADTHPLHNLRVNVEVKALGGDAAAWNRRWVEEGLAALETLLERRAGAYAFGDSPTLLDCYCVPMAYSARRFGVDLTTYPRFDAAVKAAEAHPDIARAHPDRQPDAVPA